MNRGNGPLPEDPRGLPVSPVLPVPIVSRETCRMDGRSRTMMTSVLIVGGGPVGMTLALDLSCRGIDVVVAERRPANAEPSVKCGQIAARSMEVFRRLGLADKLRCVGLPADYPNDIVSTT